MKNLLRNIICSLTLVAGVNVANAAPIVQFEIDGNTWHNPYHVFNNSTNGEKITSFIMDLRDADLAVCFDDQRNSDCHPTLGEPLKFYNDSETVTGLLHTSLIDADGGIAALDFIEFRFNDFDPNEVFTWNIETDLFYFPSDTKHTNTGSSFGNELIGSAVTVNFDSGHSLVGRMAEISGNSDASQFVVSSVQVVNEPIIASMFAFAVASLLYNRRRQR